MTHRILAIAAGLWLAGCASVDSEQGVATAQHWHRGAPWRAVKPRKGHRH
jgi:hypothetical protein